MNNRFVRRCVSTSAIFALVLAPPAARIPAAGQSKPPAAIHQAGRPGGVWISAVGDLADRRWTGYGVNYLTAVPGRDEVIAGVAAKGLWSSKDGGVTWTQLGTPGQIGADPFYINFDPKNPDIFWITCIHGSDIFKTTNAGRSFEILKSGGGETLSVDFEDPDRRTLLTAEHERANTLTISVSSGRSWHSLSENIPPGAALMPNAFLYGDNCIIAGSDSRNRPGIFRSPDAGKTWFKVADYVPGWRHARFGNKPGVIYWSGATRGFLKSDDGGKSWSSFGGPIAAPPIETPNGALVSFGGNRLFTSHDGGATWLPLGPPIPFDPWGFTYNSKRNAYYVWRLTAPKGGFDRTAILRWAP